MKKNYTRGHGIALLTLFLINLMLVGSNLVSMADNQNMLGNSDRVEPLLRTEVSNPTPSPFEQVNSWWNETFRYRVQVSIQEPGISARSNEPVSVWLPFETGTCSNYSIRVVPGNEPQPSQTDIVSQLSNITYSGTYHDYILSCTVHFEVSVPQSSNVFYFIYFTDNVVEDKSSYYQSLTGSVQTTFEGNNAVTMNNGKIELKFANQSNEYSLKVVGGAGTNYATQYALEPSSVPFTPSTVNAPTLYNTNTYGFIMNWLMAGPYVEGSTDWNLFYTYTAPRLSLNPGQGGYNSHNKVDVRKSYVAGDSVNGSTWATKSSSEATGLCDLNTMLANQQNVAGYALAYVYFPTVPGTVYAKVCSDDGYGLWINGQQVAYNHILRGVTGSDQEAIQVNAYLHQGWNRVLFLCEEQGGAWSMRLRFATDNTLRTTSDYTNVLLNLKVAYAPVGFIDNQAGSIEQGQNGLTGPVFTQFHYHICQTEDMVVEDNVTFFQNLNMYKVQRKLYFTGVRTTGNNSFGVFNDFVPNPSNTFDDYIYDGNLVNIGSTISPQNYTLVRDADGGDFFTTTGDFITNISRGNGATTFSSLQWQVTYVNNVVQLMPGITTNLNNLAGLPQNYFVITFWKFLAQNIGQGLDETSLESLANQIYAQLLNPLAVTAYSANTESLFFNLGVECRDIDGNPAPGVTVTLINSTDNINGWSTTKQDPISEITDDNGVAHFIRLVKGNYTANMTYSAYGFPAINVNPEGINWGARNITVDTTHDEIIEDICLTDLRLTFKQFDTDSLTEKGPIIGGTVSFYTNWSFQAPTHIGDLVTDNNGFVDFYWHNYTGDIANTTFTMNFLGALRPLNFTNVGVTPFTPNLNVTMNYAASYTVDVQIGDFSTNLQMLSGSLVDTYFWGESLPVSVQYYYNQSIGEVIPIPGATVTYNLYISSTFTLINSSSLVETVPGTYDINLDSSAPWLDLRADTSYQMVIVATRSGFTPQTKSIIISLKPITSGLIGNTSVNVIWNDNFTVRYYYNDTLHENTPLTGASVTYQATSIPSINGLLLEEGDGWYNFTLNTTEFIFADTYTMLISATKENYEIATALVIIHIAKIQTYVADWINPTRQKITIQDVVNQYVTTTLIMTFNYTQADGTGIEDATTASYEWQDELGTIGSGSLVFEGAGIYSLDFNTENLPIMQYSLVIHLGKQNYVERQAAVTLNIIAIPGVAATTDLVLTRTQRSSTTYSFTLTDGRPGHTSEIYPQTVTNVNVEFTSPSTFNKSFLSWLNGTNDGIFNLTVDTKNITAGTYVMRVTFSRVNFTNVVETLTLTVNQFLPSVTIPTGVVSFVEGSTVIIPISVLDGLLGQTFEGIKITWAVQGTELNGIIETVDPDGNYEISIAPELLSPNANYNMTISIEVTTNGVTYALNAVQLVNFQVNYALIFGIPRPYFWYILIAIGAAVGIFAAYRSIKYARIPQFVKDINATRNLIRKGKSVGRESIVESRAASIGNALESRYAALGMSATEKFAPKVAEPKEETKGERKPEEEVA